MVRTPQYVRVAISEIWEEQRQRERCTIVYKLTNDAKELSKTYDAKIKELAETINTLSEEKANLEGKRRKELRDAKLETSNFTRDKKDVCRFRALNDQLKIFDDKTNDGILQIMIRDEVNESILNELVD